MRSFVLIETLWNVNIIKRCVLMCGATVLIETLWNVNSEKDLFFVSPNIVLIETLWNVNSLKMPPPRKGQKRINRNIVECKCVPVSFACALYWY